MRGRPRKNSIPPDSYKDVVGYYTVLNKTLQEIADVFGVTQYAVRNVLKEYGVTTRPRGARPKVVETGLTGPL